MFELSIKGKHYMFSYALFQMELALHIQTLQWVFRRLLLSTATRVSSAFLSSQPSLVTTAHFYCLVLSLLARNFKTSLQRTSLAFLLVGFHVNIMCEITILFVAQ